MLARQCHSAEWRERIFFPLSFAFFALARLLATVLFAEQMCWVAFLPALRAVCAARWLAPSLHISIIKRAPYTWLKAMRLLELG